MRCALPASDALTHFVEDSGIDLDDNAVECALRPLALSRKNALSPDTDEGSEKRAAIALLAENGKLTGVKPHTWLTSHPENLTKGKVECGSTSLCHMQAA